MNLFSSFRAPPEHIYICINSASNLAYLVSCAEDFKVFEHSSLVVPMISCQGSAGGTRCDINVVYGVPFLQ